MKSRIMYVLVLLLAVFMFVWTGSKEACFLLAFLLLLIPVFVFINALASKNVLVEAHFIPGASDVVVEYINKGILCVFNIETKLHLVNTYTDTEVSFVRSKALLPKSKRVVEIPIESDYCGRIEISMSECNCVDLLGLSRYKVKSKAKGSTYIYPELIYENEEELIKQARENTSDTAYYQNRKGNDITEILNIREYEKGDSMKSIHWKLSLKHKQKLVREYDMPVNQEVIVLFALSDELKDLPMARHILARYVLGAVELLYNEQIFFDGVLIGNNGVRRKYTIDSEEAYEWYVLRLLDGELSFAISELDDYIVRESVEKKYSTIIMITDDRIITEEYEHMGVTHIVANIEEK